MKDITHEEARSELLEIENYLEHSFDVLDDYITQQQAKEERAKKKHELLELYRKENKIRKEMYESVHQERIQTLMKILIVNQEEIDTLEEGLK